MHDKVFKDHLFPLRLYFIYTWETCFITSSKLPLPTFPHTLGKEGGKYPLPGSLKGDKYFISTTE